MAMGNGVYDIVANGHVNSYPLFINPPNAAALMTRLNAGGNIRIVVGTAGSTVAATWAGHTNTTYVGPRLELEVQYDTGVPTVAGTWGRIKSAYR